MLEQRQELKALENPVDWYLRFGAMGLTLHNGFTPIIYWGLHHDVFISGADPLLHYICFGEEEKRGY